MLIIAFTGLRDRIKVWENSKDLRLSATCDGRAESDAESKKPNWFRCMGSHYMYNRKGPSVSSASRKTSFSSSLIWVERWSAEHQLQFPSSYRCTVTLHMCRMQVSWQTRGGRKTVTKANNRKHKSQNQSSQNARCGTLFCGENKTVACRRQPQSLSLNKPVCSVVRCSESRTAHSSSIRKK